jgi:hypothetical protein
MRPEHIKTQFWASMADIPTDKEKEVEWEKINPKMLRICPSYDKQFPTIQSRAA